MSTPKMLSIYLRDHHAAASAAVQVTRRMAKQNEDSPFGDHIDSLQKSVADSRRRLEEVMDLLDVDTSAVKDAGAWLGEKFGRLKLNGRVVSYSPLSRVVELEGLKLATELEIEQWRALAVARQSDERLGAVDFEALVEHASQRLDQLDTLHRQACEAAFVDANGN